MKLRVSRSLLEAALQNLIQEAEPAPEVQPAAPTEPAAPEEDLDNAGLIAKKAEELKKSNKPQFSSGDRTFTKQGGKFFLKDIQLTTADLLQLVNDEAKVRIEKEISKGAQTIGVRAEEFIEPVSRGASFESQGKGTWVDLSEIPADVVAEYMLRNEGEISDEAPYVTGEVTESAGKHLVYRTNELAIVIPEGSKDVYIMSTQNNPEDPLGSALQLLKSVNILAEWRANPIRFYELVGTGPEVGKSFALQIDEKLKLGNFNKALKSIRTLAGKAFDFLNPFEGANIEVNFKFTELGPALVRTEVFGGKGGRIQAGGLTDKDLQRLADTDYFRYEDLDKPVDAEYKFKEEYNYIKNSVEIAGKKKVPIDPSTDKNKSGNNYFSEYNKLVIRETGESKCFFGSDEGNGNNTQTAFYGFGRALWIYMKGYLEAKESAPPVETPAPVAPAPKPVDDPNKPWNDAVGAINKTINEPVKGAVLYDFSVGNTIASQDPMSYVGDVASFINALVDKLPKEPDYSKLEKFSIYIIGTADTIDKEPKNLEYSNARIKTLTLELGKTPKFKDAYKKLNFDENKDDQNELMNLIPISLGESPWEGKDSVWGKKLDNDKRKWLRQAKICLGPYVKPTDAEAQCKKIALDYASEEGHMPTVAQESSQHHLIRSEIRKILREIRSR